MPGRSDWFLSALEVVVYTVSIEESLGCFSEAKASVLLFFIPCALPGFVFDVINIFPCRWPVETLINELHLLEFLVQSRVTFVFNQVTA